MIEGPDVNVLESVFLRSSELTRCEWCTVKKLPVLFLQTTDEECQRLRTQLQMFRDEGGIWYDSSGNSEYQNVTVNVSFKAKYAISAVLVTLQNYKNKAYFQTTFENASYIHYDYSYIISFDIPKHLTDRKNDSKF